MFGLSPTGAGVVDNSFAGVPGRQGCIKLANIREAIQLWLEVAEEDARREAASELGTQAEVTV